MVVGLALGNDPNFIRVRPHLYALRHFMPKRERTARRNADGEKSALLALLLRPRLLPARDMHGILCKALSITWCNSGICCSHLQRRSLLLFLIRHRTVPLCPTSPQPRKRRRWRR